MVQGLEAKTFGRRYYFEKEEIFDWEMAVLVAVSIPIFTSQLEKSREATDTANLRAAKAAAVSAYLDGAGDKYDLVISDTCYYNSAEGVLDNAGDTCGKGTKTPGSKEDILFVNGVAPNYTPTDAVQGYKIKVKVTEPAKAGDDAQIDVHFVAAS